MTARPIGTLAAPAGTSCTTWQVVNTAFSVGPYAFTSCDGRARRQHVAGGARVHRLAAGEHGAHAGERAGIGARDHVKDRGRQEEHGDLLLAHDA